MTEKLNGHTSKPSQPVEVFFKTPAASDPERFLNPRQHILETDDSSVARFGIAAAVRSRAQSRVEQIPPETGADQVTEPEPTDE